MASDHTFYNIFVSQKVTLWKISDDVIACHFWFGPPPRGVFRGAIGPWPPLWIAKIAKLHRKVSKIEACPPPPLQVEHQALGSKSPDFEQKMGRNFVEDLFFLLVT